jgi:hypothetical protein
MSSKRIEIFKKASNHFKKASNSCTLENSLAEIATMASPPLGAGV